MGPSPQLTRRRQPHALGGVLQGLGTSGWILFPGYPRRLGGPQLVAASREGRAGM